MNYLIRYSIWSTTGKVRKKNQDNFYCNGKYLYSEDDQSEYPINGYFSSCQQNLVGVFDGIGGGQAGEIAAYIAAKAASEFKATDSGGIEDLKSFCKKTNDAICRYQTENSIYSMGCTAAILAFYAKEIIVLNIGDSKVFRFSNKLEQISKDHYDLSVDGRKPALSQSLGIPEDEMIIHPAIARGLYNEGDIYLICSDGLTDMLSDEEISRIISESKFESIANWLITAAMDQGGYDNTTVILCKIENHKLNRLAKIL